MALDRLPTELKLTILDSISSNPDSSTPNLIRFATSCPALYSIYTAERTRLLRQALSTEFPGLDLKWLLALLNVNNATYCHCSFSGPRFMTLSEYDVAQIIRRIIGGAFVLQLGDYDAMKIIARALSTYSLNEKKAALFIAITRHCLTRWSLAAIGDGGINIAFRDALFELFDVDIDTVVGAAMSINWTFHNEIMERAKLHFGYEWAGITETFVESRIPTYWFNLVLHTRVPKDEVRVRAILEQFPHDEDVEPEMRS